MATHFSVFALEISWTEEPDELWGPRGHKELDMTERIKQKKKQKISKGGSYLERFFLMIIRKFEILNRILYS